MRSLRTHLFSIENASFEQFLISSIEILLLNFSTNPEKWLGWQHRLWTKESLIQSAQNKINDHQIIDAIIFLLLSLMRTEESLSEYLQN